MVVVRNDQGPNVILGNFESTASFLLHYDPVSRRKSVGDNRDHDFISKSNTEVSSSLVTHKPSMPKF